mgnify:CR=1 FL=1
MRAAYRVHLVDPPNLSRGLEIVAVQRFADLVQKIGVLNTQVGRPLGIVFERFDLCFRDISANVDVLFFDSFHGFLRWNVSSHRSGSGR